MTQEEKDKIANALGITHEDQQVLDAGSDHPYTCRCTVCLYWWILMGPEDPDSDEPSYGPFRKAEIDAAKAKAGEE